MVLAAKVQKRTKNDEGGCAYFWGAMTTKQMKIAIAAAVAKVPDAAPTEMLQRVLDAVEALAGADMGKLERMQRFMRNIEEDQNLLHRLAQ